MSHLKFVFCFMATSLVAGPAFAQTSPPASGSSNTTASSGQFLTEQKPDQWRASNLKGLNVYNNDEKIGDITDFVLDREGKVAAVVVGVGGFLGMGERNVALPFTEVKFLDEPRRTATATSPTAPSTASRPAAPMGDTTGATTTATTARRDVGTRSGPDHAMVNMSKDQLKAAPEFKR